MIQTFFFFSFSDKEDKKKESKTTQQASCSSTTGIQQQQGHCSVQPQSQNRPSLQQSEWQRLGKPPAANLQQRPQNLCLERFSCDPVPLKTGGSQEKRSEQGPGEKKPGEFGPQKQEQHKQVQLQSEQGAWQQDHRSNQRHQGGFSGAESLKSTQRTAPQAGPSDDAKMQQKRPGPITSEDLKKQGTEELEPKCGTSLGKIETKYLRLSIDKILANIYHYDVSFEPELPKKYLAKVFKKFIGMNFPGAVFIAFDGSKNAYAWQQLKITDLQQNVKLIHPENGKWLTFKVSIKEANNTKIQLSTT